MRQIFALLLILAATAPAPAAAERIRRSEVYRLSDEILARRLFGDFGSDLFVGHRNRDARPPRFRAFSLYFWTRPRRASVPGVCETEQIAAILDNVAPGLDENGWLRLASIRSQSWFIVENRDLAHRRTGIAPREMEGLEAACAALDPRSAERRAPADSAFQLIQAYRLTEALGEAARVGRPPAGLDCSQSNFNGPEPSEAECLTPLSVLRERSVVGVQGCAEYQVYEGGCVRAQTDDWFIYFLLDPAQSPSRILVRGMEDLSQVHWVYD